MEEAQWKKLAKKYVNNVKGGEELEKVARLLGTEITNREANKKQ